MSQGKVLVYLVRRDLRVADNPILHSLSTSSDHGFTHLLPVYVFPSHQVEISGFLKDGESSPYPEARSVVGGYWRAGPHRVKFLAQSVWDMKQSLEQLNSGLLLRVGSLTEVLKSIFDAFKGKTHQIGGVYMTEEKSWEEVQEQNGVQDVCKDHDIPYKLWPDEKYFIDDRDTGLEDPADLPDVFTTYRKGQEPLRDRPRIPLPGPEKSKLPLWPDSGLIPGQAHPFVEPRSLEDLEAGLLKPLKDIMTNPPTWPADAASAHPFRGGETRGLERLVYLTESGGMTKYKDTRNGLLGEDFSTKLSAYLALGCITARQVHHELVRLEDGQDEKYSKSKGYGEGENDGTKAVRFELLWRDYMRLCTMKFGRKLFRLGGFRAKQQYDKEWKSGDTSSADRKQDPPAADIARILERTFNGTTGLGLIDASQRELFLTGYTSNRARQNVASFLTKQLQIDWRYGAEWYEMMLVDYDVSSNWANWQYVAGVGNDPRGEQRNFNPVKQAFDYDKEGAYVRTWVPEVRDLDRLEAVFQPSTANAWELAKCNLASNVMVTHPVKRIQFMPNRKPRSTGRSRQHKQGVQERRRGDGWASHPQARAHEDGAADNTPRRGGSNDRGRRGGSHRGRGRPERGGEFARDVVGSSNQSPGKQSRGEADGLSKDAQVETHQPSAASTPQVKQQQASSEEVIALAREARLLEDQVNMYKAELEAHRRQSSFVGPRGVRGGHPGASHHGSSYHNSYTIQSPHGPHAFGPIPENSMNNSALASHPWYAPSQAPPQVPQVPHPQPHPQVPQAQPYGMPHPAHQAAQPYPPMLGGYYMPLGPNMPQPSPSPLAPPQPHNMMPFAGQDMPGAGYGVPMPIPSHMASGYAGYTGVPPGPKQMTPQAPPYVPIAARTQAAWPDVAPVQVGFQAPGWSWTVVSPDGSKAPTPVQAGPGMPMMGAYVDEAGNGYAEHPSMDGYRYLNPIAYRDLAGSRASAAF